MKKLDIAKMRAACKAAAETLRVVGQAVRPGITTDELNLVVHNDTIRRCGYPAPLGYKGFPKSVCVSVNDVVCHGIPGPYVLNEGDIVNVDVTTIIDGHFGDTNATFRVGAVSSVADRLILTAQFALDEAIKQVKPGARLGVIGKTIQRIAHAAGFSVVKEFGGHGIGTRFHTFPHVDHYDSGDQTVINEGDVFTIEPMLCVEDPRIAFEDDGWTVRTCDGGLSAQFEHTVLVTVDGCDVLTRLL